MSVGKSLFRIWLMLSLASLAIDAACFWLSAHTPAAVPDRPTVNYVVIFMLSAPMPFALAVLFILTGMLFSVMRGLWTLVHVSRQRSTAAAFIPRSVRPVRERDVFRVDRINPPQPQTVAPAVTAQFPVVATITSAADSART
jgi:hypothetical protein